MWEGPFSIRRFSLFCFALFSSSVIGFSDAGVVNAFWPDFLNPWKSKENSLPVSGTGIDLKASGEAVAEAKKLVAEGNFNEAIARYTEAINRNPQDPVLYFERGCLYYYRMMTGPPEKEMTVVSPAVEPTQPQLDPHPPVEKEVAVVALPGESTEPPLVESTEPPPVESTQPPPEPRATTDLEPASNAKEPCVLALADLNQAIALRPNYGIFFYMRGMVLSASTCSDQNLEKAIENYNQAINLGPSNAAYYQERGNARAKLKQYGQAINDMDQAILIEPNNYYLYYDKGRIQEQIGMTREAAVSYKGALELAPPDQMGPFLLALKGARSDNRRVLIADYTDLIAKRPAVFSLYVHRGLLYEDEKKYNSAIDDFSTALSFQKDNGDLYFTRGKIFYEAGKNADSLKDFQTSCRLKQPAACHYVQLLEKEVNRGDRWVPFWYSRNNQKYFYDRQHLKTQGGSFKVARVRIEADDSGEENPAGADNTVPGKERGDYTLESWEFNCPGSQIRISTVKRFDRDGQIIASEPDLEKAFRPVSPGGFSEKLYRIVCRQGEKKGTPKKSVILE
jgi:tetratricopeptide (TPR) repeat protein